MFRLLISCPKVFRCVNLSVRTVTTKKDDFPLVLTDDGSIFVSWHPPKDFPYECSKNIPKSEPTRSILKRVDKREVYETFRSKPQQFVIDELAKITYTTKHRWYPRSRDKKAKNTPPDREYL